MSDDLFNHIFILTGPVHGGKTTRAAGLVEKVRNMGEPVEGFLAYGRFEGGERSGFTLEDIRQGSRLPLASIRNEEGWIRYGRFCFNPEALHLGRSIITRAFRENPRLIVIDEVGPMELAGRGWSNLLDQLRERKEIRQLWVVREGLADHVMSRWNISRNNRIPMEGMTDQSILEKILDDC